MDFMKWLNSLDELLYEIMSWLVFFPVTLWRAVTRPMNMMEYSERELHDSADQQFTDTLSPPLFLVLALLLSHGLELALGGGTNPIVARKSGLAALVSDDSSLLMLRLLLFSLFPLMLATRLVWARHHQLTRQRLKAPFYAQCYPAAVFALFLGLGVTIGHQPSEHAPVAGVVISAGAVIYYILVQTLWFSRRLEQGFVRGLGNAMLGFAMGFALFIITAALFTR
jgi:hypothetical protein